MFLKYIIRVLRKKMEWYKVLKIARNIFGHCVIHPFVIICTLWVVGALVAIFTNETKAIALDLSTINIGYRWGDWLFKAWPQLSFTAYNYLKIKLLLAILVPPITVIGFYIKNFARIKTLEFFLMAFIFLKNMTGSKSNLSKD